MDEDEGVEEEVSLYNFSLEWIIASYTLAVIGFAVTFACFFVFGALLANRKIRKNPYNVYIIFLILPDAIHTFFVTIHILTPAINDGRTFPPGLFPFFFYTYIFYFFCNFFLNAVVTYEMNKLVIQSYQRKRAQPPQLAKVYKQVIAVYLYAIAFATWALLPIKWSPLYILREGDTYRPRFGSSQEGGFSPLAGQAITFGQILFPLIYVLYVRIKIGVKKLLPNKGRTRVLSAFFMRIITVFLLCYIPNIAISTIIMRVKSEVVIFWLMMSARTISLLQASITLFMIWQKDDIQSAVIRAFNMTFGRCYCCCEIKVAKRRRRSSLGETTEASGSVRISGLSAPHLKNAWNESDVYNNSSRCIVVSAASNASGADAAGPVTSQVPTKSEWEQDDEFDDRDNHAEVNESVIEEESTQAVQDDDDNEDCIEKGSSCISVDMTGQVS